MSIANGNETEPIKQNESQESEKTKKKKKIIKKKTSEKNMETILDNFDESKDLKKQLVDKATDLICKRSDIEEDTKALIKKVKEDFDALRISRDNETNDKKEIKKAKKDLKDSVKKLLSEIKKDEEKNGTEIYDTINEFYSKLSTYLNSTKKKGKEQQDRQLDTYIKFYVSVRNALREEKPYLNESEFAEKLKEKFGENFSGESNSQT